MNWVLVLQYAVSGAIVSWPVFIAGLVVSHRKTRQHVDEITGAQTEKIAEITDRQTAHLERGRHRDHPGGYHGHGDIHP